MAVVVVVVVPIPAAEQVREFLLGLMSLVGGGRRVKYRTEWSPDVRLLFAFSCTGCWVFSVSGARAL